MPFKKRNKVNVWLSFSKILIGNCKKKDFDVDKWDTSFLSFNGPQGKYFILMRFRILQEILFWQLNSNIIIVDCISVCVIDFTDDVRAHQIGWYTCDVNHIHLTSMHILQTIWTIDIKNAKFQND